MADFASVAHLLEQAANLITCTPGLNADSALRRAVWGDEPMPHRDGPDLERYYVAARVVEIQYCAISGADLGCTHVSDIPRLKALGAAREMARLFRQVASVGGRPRMEGDADEVSRVMWERAQSTSS